MCNCDLHSSALPKGQFSMCKIGQEVKNMRTLHQLLAFYRTTKIEYEASTKVKQLDYVIK